MLKEAVRRMYHPLYRWVLRARFAWNDKRESTVGLPPALLRFRVSESLSADSFVNIGRACGNIIGTRIREAQIALGRGSRVLDFGCGCGRTLTWLIRSYPAVNFYGCDVDAEAITWCRENLATAEFLTNDALPPLPYESRCFDVIYSFSVFTHLNEKMQDAWLGELRRIVKPDGLLILTVHGRNAAAILTPAERAVLDTNGFLHKTSRKLVGVVPSWYHTTWHAQPYLTARLSKLFGSVSYIQMDDSLQDCAVASRPLGS